MGALQAGPGQCCVDDYDDRKKESDKKKALVEQQEYENSIETKIENTPIDYHNNIKETISFESSIYHNKLSYIQMSKRYNYRKPPNFYDDCIRKLRKSKRRYQSTQKQSQYDAIIQYTSKSILRARTMLTASFEEQQQTSGTNLIHDISENDEKFWFQPFLYNVIDSITTALCKLIDSKQDLLLNYIDIYQLLTLLPVLSDVLHKDYPFHFHNQIHDRLKYLFNENDVTYIKTKQDIINLILKANKSNRKICAVGYATTISPNKANTKDQNALIAAMIPNHLRIHTLDTQIEYTDDLSRCSVPHYPLMYIEDLGGTKIKVGGATPLWLYVQWCHKRIESNKLILSDPSNSNCNLFHSFVGLITVDEHGAGYMSKPLSDYVTKMIVVNSEGKENVYAIENDEKEFKSLLPHLGLLGIVTEIELLFEEESQLELKFKVLNIDKLFPKSKSKKTKGRTRTFSKMFEDIINSALYNEFLWHPTTNQIYVYSGLKSLSQSQCKTMWPSKTWEKNWIALQREINIVNEIICIQLLNCTKWTSQLATKLITKISVNLLNDLVVKLNGLRPQIRKTSSPRVNTPVALTLPSCDAVQLLGNVNPSQSNNNLFTNVEWLFPLDSKSGKKILINDHPHADVELAAHLFMSAINCYNQNMLKRRCFPYQHALNLKIFKGSSSDNVDFYCAINMNIYDIKNNVVFQQFHKEFIQTCKYKVYSGNVDNIKPHWKAIQFFNFMPIDQKQNGYNDNKNDIFSFIKYQYNEKLDKLNKIRYRDNKNPQIFGHKYVEKFFQ